MYAARCVVVSTRAARPLSGATPNARLLPLYGEAAPGLAATGDTRVEAAADRIFAQLEGRRPASGDARAGRLQDAPARPGDTQASASSWVSAHTTVKGSTEAVAARLLDLAPSFDRAIACDEPLLRPLVETTDVCAVLKSRYGVGAPRSGAPMTRSSIWAGAWVRT